MTDRKYLEENFQEYLFPNFSFYQEHSDNLIQTKGYFLGDGEKVVQRLLDSDIKIKELLTLPKYINPQFEEKLRKHPEIETIWVASSNVLKKIRGYDLHQGIMALACAPPLEHFPSMGPILVCNKILEANNIGSLIRSSKALGVTQLIIDFQSCHPYIRRSVRVSMGTVFDLKILRSNNLSEELFRLKTNGYSIIGASADKVNDKETISYKNFFPNPNTAIVLGNEAHGIDKEIQKVCDAFVHIPMQNGVDSLNVSVTGAILASKWLEAV
jgi:tRNA G18 (ribose-2'-O)-methylase SpoU